MSMKINVYARACLLLHFPFQTSVQLGGSPAAHMPWAKKRFLLSNSLIHFTAFCPSSRGLHSFQTSEGVSDPICIPLMISIGNKKDTYACTHRHVSRDTLENSDKTLAEHKNTYSLRINPTIGSLQFFPHLNITCLSNRNIPLYLCPMNLFPIW